MTEPNGSTDNGTRWVYGTRDPDPAAVLDERLRAVDLAIAQAMDLLNRAAAVIDEIRHGR